MVVKINTCSKIIAICYVVAKSLLGSKIFAGFFRYNEIVAFITNFYETLDFVQS